MTTCFAACAVNHNGFERSRSEEVPVFHFTLDVHFPNEEEKQAFVARLNAVRDLFSLGGEKIHNYELLSQLFALAENTACPPAAARPQPDNTISMLSSSGKSVKLCNVYPCANRGIPGLSMFICSY